MSLLQMSFYGAVMILAIAVIRRFAMDRLPKRVFVLLWELALFRLLLPFSVPSPLSAYAFVGKTGVMQHRLAQIPAGNTVPQALAIQTDRYLSPGEALPVPAPSMEISFRVILWAAGMLLCAGIFTLAYLRCYFEFRTSLPVDDPAAEEWLLAHRLRRRIQIRRSHRISAPLTYGIVRPVILMPGKTDWKDTGHLQYVLLHEYLHIRRFDTAWKLVMAAALCLHWFNPVVWMMYYLFNRDIELSCDEGVVRQLGEKSRASYARTLLFMEEKKSGMTPFCNNFSKNAIEQRITSIMKTKKITWCAAGAGAAVVAVVAVFLATSAPEDDSSQKDREKAAIEEVREEPTEETAETKDRQGFDEIWIEAPGEVLDAANSYVEGQYADRRNRGDNYSDYRIESLEPVYTYDDFQGMVLEIYRMNYEFFSPDPEKLELVGGMSADEEGWVVPWYPNSTYLIFRREGEKLVYLTVLGENDCLPGEQLFTEDLGHVLENLREDWQSGSTRMISYELEGFWEEMPASLYGGEGFTIYIPQMGWNVYKPWNRPVELEAVYQDEIRIWVEHFADEIFSETEERLLSEGYDYADSGIELWERKLYRLEGEKLLEARLIAGKSGVWVVYSAYNPAYEWGSRLDAIAATFAITDYPAYGEEQGAGAKESGDGQEAENIMTAFCEAYFARDKDAIRTYLIQSLQEQPIPVYEGAMPEIRGIKGGFQPGEEGKKQLSLECIDAQGSCFYLTVSLVKEKDVWKISGYGLEK